MAWGVGGWLLFPFLMKIGPEAGNSLRQRVVAELKTTFASHYTKVVSLQETLQLDNIAVYGKRARAIGRGALTALEALVLRGHEGEVFDGVITSERDGRGELVLTEPAVVTEIRAGKKASDGGLPVGERVRVRLLSADPTSGIRFQLLTHQP